MSDGMRFRKKTFGGFDPDDVVKYIAKIANQRNEAVDLLNVKNKELEELRKRCDDKANTEALKESPQEQQANAEAVKEDPQEENIEAVKEDLQQASTEVAEESPQQQASAEAVKEDSQQQASIEIEKENLQQANTEVVASHDSESNKQNKVKITIRRR